MILESLGCIDFSVNFRLDLEDDSLPSFFDDFDRIEIIVCSAKSSWIYQLKIAFGASTDILT